VIAAVVLAAGLSRRMGRPKLLEDLDGEPVIRRTVQQVVDAGLRSITVVVAAAQRAAFACALEGLPVRIVANPRPEEGQSSSLRIGVASLPSGTSASLIVLGDQPRLPAEVIPKLLQAAAEGSAAIVAPRYGGARGNPVLFRAAVFPELAALSGDQGARSVIDRDPRRLQYVEVSDAMPQDIDTPEDLARLRARPGGGPGVD
jgi:molybdenum cofactor cytidylyltransferase